MYHPRHTYEDEFVSHFTVYLYEVVDTIRHFDDLTRASVPTIGLLDEDLIPRIEHATLRDVTELDSFMNLTAGWRRVRFNKIRLMKLYEVTHNFE